MSYITNSNKQAGCVFCNALARDDGPDSLVVQRGEYCFSILNRYPYTSGHIMIVPVIHQSSLELLDAPTRAEIMELCAVWLEILRQEYRPQGFNVGFNIGEAAGAGIEEHIHLHIVPRWNGDTNFMSTLASTRVLPEALEDTYWRLRNAWEKRLS